MSRRQLDPLRPLTAEERGWLARISLSHSEPAAHVGRATMLLAVAAGQSYTVAAHAAGRRSGDAVAHLVSRFNHDGVAAVEPRHGGGPPTVYTSAERDRILAEARRLPDPVRDGTADVVACHTAAGTAGSAGRPAAGERLHPLAGPARSRTDVAA